MTVRCRSDRKRRQCTGKRLSRAIRSSLNKEGMSHLCGSAVAGPAARRDNGLASKSEYPPFWYHWVAGGPLQERPLQFQPGNVCVKSWQPMSNAWSASSEPDFVRALGRRTTARYRQGKIFYKELLQRWPTLGQLLANSPPHGKLQGPSLQSSSGSTRYHPFKPARIYGGRPQQ